jgi:quinol monooxygenase YgiN
MTAQRHRLLVAQCLADEHAFAAHLATAHCEAFNEALAPHVAGGQSELTMLATLA